MDEKKLEETIDDLRSELIKARQLADRYNEDRQKLILQVQRLRALVRMMANVLSNKAKEAKERKDDDEKN